MDPIKILKDYKFYDREWTPKHLSASSISKDILELWHETQNWPQDARKLTDADVGSLVHLALELIFKDTPEHKDGKLIIEERYQKLVDGWTISGKPDMIDQDAKVIWDFKTSKNYTSKMIKKDGKNHTYAIQMAVYNFLLGGGYEAKLMWFMKDSSAPNLEPVIFTQDIEIYSPEEIENMIREKIKTLEAYGDNMPDACKDLWPRKVRINGKYTFLKDTKCRFYCRYSTTCQKREVNLMDNIKTF